MMEMTEMDRGMITSLRGIAYHYGYDDQSRQCVEEMAELTQAISKLWRGPLKHGAASVASAKGTDEYCNVIEEIADVEVMLIQVASLLGIEREQILDAMGRKIERTKMRIVEEGVGDNAK